MTPIFIMGSPRSGTTMLGQLIGSAPNTLHMGELSSLYFSHWIAAREYRNVPSPFKDYYLQSLQQHSINFLYDLARKHQSDYLVEDTPWNFRIIPELDRAFPDALYIISLRDYRGVIQSMQKSYDQGYKWAGPTDIDRAKLWADCYAHLVTLPKDRTLIFDYDMFCKNPEHAIKKLEQDLVRKQVNCPFQIEALATQVALNEKKNLPVSIQGKDIIFSSISSFNAHAWSDAQQKAVWPYIKDAEKRVFKFKATLIDMAQALLKKPNPTQSHNLG